MVEANRTGDEVEELEAADLANEVGNAGTDDKAVVTTDEVEVFGRAVVETIPPQKPHVLAQFSNV